MPIQLRIRRIRFSKLFTILLSILLIYYIAKQLSFQSNSNLTYRVDDVNENIVHEKENMKDLQKKGLKFQQDSLIDNKEVDEQFLLQLDKKVKKCHDYREYSQQPHPPFSKGKYRYPYMRPAPKCRTFTSEAVEYLIKDLKNKVEDDDLSRLIENCLPNTLDTTILWHKSSLKDKLVSKPQSFVVTGDIHAEWLRDAARQLSVYQPLIKYDEDLKELIKGAINTQAQFILNSPYCNAFHPPPGSNVKKGETAFDNVYPRPDWRQVFECKYEVDSLASFLTLTNDYYEHSGGDLSFLSSSWIKAFEKLLIVFKRESQPSFDKETGQARSYYYLFQRSTNIGSETLPLGGVGNPVNYGAGLIRSAFRPSDDSTILQFFIPGNIHALTELKRLRNGILNEDLNKIYDVSNLIKVTDTFIDDLTEGINKYGIVNHPEFGKVYAYEVDGYGSSIFMDDANIPSLLAIPDMGFTNVEDEIYQATRKMILSKSGNPYYLKGLHFEGIGGPHIGIHNAWPMSLLVRIRTTDDEDEIKMCLEFIMKNTAYLGLMHESINVNSENGLEYTRSWFAWCNSEFGKTILHLAKYKPHLIFKAEFADKPYNIENVFLAYKKTSI